MTWVLILFAHVGMMGNGNSNALTNVPGFKSEDSCIAAGRRAKLLANGSVKQISFVCVEVK